MKFRKKPVVVEAWLWTGWVKELWNEAPPWVVDACDPGIEGQLIVKTMEGTMVAQPCDWIIRGIKGEVYPCRPDIFEATYEPVEDPGASARGGES